MPGKKKRGGIRGQDYFVGEVELMRYLDQIDLAELHASRQSAAQTPSEQSSSTATQSAALTKDSERQDATADPSAVGNAQDDTAVEASGGADSIDRSARVQVVDAVPTTSPALYRDQAIIQGVSPHDTTFDGADLSSGEDTNTRPDTSPPTRRNLSSAFVDAVESQPAAAGSLDSTATFVEMPDAVDVPSDHVATAQEIKYATLDSDTENDEGTGWDIDDIAEEGDVELDDDGDAPPPPELMFDRSLLEAVGGVDRISSGGVPDQLLQGMAKNGWGPLTTQTPYEYLMEPYEPRPPTAMLTDYPRLYDEEYGPTPRALEAAATPSGAFFFFMQPTLWEDIAAASNDYFSEKLDERVGDIYNKQVARERKYSNYTRKGREKIRAELDQLSAITAREVCVFIGLLIARTIAPNKEKLENHWKTTDEGAIPRGCFGSYMVRDRFMHLSRNLHFSDNSDERAQVDRAWKLRPVVEALQQRFQAGYTPPATMAFDEAMLPSQSTFNKMRVFMKDKPHRWGTKLFMLCCSTSAYCIRFEVYCGKQAGGRNGAAADYNSGPAAVVRNLREVFGATRPVTGAMRLIVTDRFYTSVPLAMQLLTMGFYLIGTVQTDRLGLPVSIVGEKKKGERKKKPPKNRPASIERGTFEVTDHLQISGLRALRWWDNKAVYMLASGGSVALDRVVRREKKTGEQAEIACPRVLKDYQTLMGGVDVHDQLRLQRYSLQLAIKYKKYYKSLFLGLVDLAVVNAFIVFNARRAADGLKKMKHVKFLKQLHLELCQIREEDWQGLVNTASANTTPARSRSTPQRSGHIRVQNDEWRPGNNQTGRKRRTRVCKVCSLLKGTDGVRGGDSSVYCSECTLKTSSKRSKAWRVFLCDKARHKHNGIPITCFGLWHQVWRNGTALPHSARKRKIRARKPAPAAVEEVEEEGSESSSNGSDERQESSESTGGPELSKRARTAMPVD